MGLNKTKKPSHSETVGRIKILAATQFVEKSMFYSEKYTKKFPYVYKQYFFVLSSIKISLSFSGIACMDSIFSLYYLLVLYCSLTICLN